jgi:hypothetical protein
MPVCKTFSAAITALSMLSFVVEPAMATPTSCGFSLSFAQKDEQGAKTVKVFRAGQNAEIGGSRPLAFVVPNVKVNTDGTRISYKADDPFGRNGAINDIRNAFRNHKWPVSKFEKVRDANWQPVQETWKVLSRKIIEEDKRPGREGLPCMDSAGFLVSMTADTAIEGGFNNVGDCDQSKWIDALTVPALVLPGGSPFQDSGARKRSIVIAMSLDGDRRLAFGIVGDTGPGDEIGEASVEMNRILNGLADGDIPKNRSDAKARFQAGRTVFLVLPGQENVVPRPITGESVGALAKARFEEWGGKERLELCLDELK